MDGMLQGGPASDEEFLRMVEDWLANHGGREALDRALLDAVADARAFRTAAAVDPKTLELAMTV